MRALPTFGRRAVLALALAFVAAGPALALDPGTSSGKFEREGVKLGFTHAVALMQDNAEGVLEHPHQMRVLLTDRELPASTLHGLMFPPVRAMARRGEVRGVLLEFDPGDRNSLQVTVLAKPDDPEAFLPSVSMSNSTGLWTRLDVSDTRVAGQLKPDDDGQLAASFSAPVFTDPIQSDLKGPAAAASEPVKVLLARADALAKGDVATAYGLSTDESAAQLKALPPAVMKQAAAQVPAMLRELKAPKRVVIRRETAAVQGAHGDWFSLELVGGAWKAAD
ncbi:MAG: hypothetical protein JF588_07530 [Caulobacterales bacterium]|nr:hypothetical protein [Caulobacterales bacterium]